jgi:hypothetical protein
VRDYLQFVSVRVLPDGRFDARATLVTKCSSRFGDALTEGVAVRDQRLSESGRYAATTSFSHEVDPRVPGVGGLRAKGTVGFYVGRPASGRARGAVRVRTTYTDPDTGAELARCDTGRIRWVARRPGAGAGSGRPHVPHGVLRGTTAQDEPFLMRLSNDGGLVRRAGLTVRVGCPSGTGLPLDVVAHAVRVRGGRFGAADDFRRTFTLPNGTEVVERYSWELEGRFGERGARGTFRMRGIVRRRGDGRQVGDCSTGVIAWRALP